MEASDLYRWSGITGIVAGLLNVIVEFLPAGLGQPLDLFVNILGLSVLTALYLRQRAASGGIGFVAYVTQSFGMTLVIGFLFAQAFVLGSLDDAQKSMVLAGPTGFVTVIALAIVTFGAILFGIASWRAGVFPKWAALLLTIGFVLAPIGGAAHPIVKLIGEMILSTGLIGLSYALFTGSDAQIHMQLSS
jgi:hypothetical protein